jgi:hypothetical protein
LKLRPLNISRRSLAADFQHDAECAVNRVERRYADRHGDGPIQRLNKRFYDDAMADDGCELPAWTDALPRVGSEQAVTIFRPITMAETIHPDAREYFDASELSDVIEKAAERRVGSPGLYRHVDWVTPEGGESSHGELLGFMSEAQERSDIAHKAKVDARRDKARKRAERAGLKFQEVQALGDPVAIAEMEKARENAKKFANITRDLKREVGDRMKYGFYHAGEKRLGGNVPVAGDLYEEFHEYFGPACPYRSKLGSPSLARMAALYPRKGMVRGGNDKEALLETTSKLLALDSPYVELNRMWAGCITIELDSVWRSAAELRAKLLSIFGARMMPNLIVGRYTRDGLFARPHLIWILKVPVYYNAFREWTDPNTGEVKSVGDEDCRTGPIGKYHAVQRSLVSMLLPLGADPGCFNIWKPKNPLSPFWSTIIANDDHWASLDEFRHIEGYPKRAPSEAKMNDLAHKMREAAAGEAPVTSNLIWVTAKKEITQLVSRGRCGYDLDFRRAADQGVEALAAYIENTVRPPLEAALGDSDALDRALAKHCPHHARVYRAMRHKIRKNTKITTNEDGEQVRRNAWRGRDSAFFVMTPEIDDGVDDDRRAEIEAEIRETECTKRREHAGAQSAASVGANTYWWFAKCVIAWLGEGGTRDWLEFKNNAHYDCCEKTARKYWSRVMDALGPEGKAGDVRYIARPFIGKNVPQDLPSDVQQVTSSIVPCHPDSRSQFDCSDPPPNHRWSMVTPHDPCRPPDPAWQTDAASSARACLEPA